MSATRISLILLAAIATATACGDAGPPTVARAPSVAVSPVSQVSIQEQIQATGQLLARQHAEIAAEISGRVTVIVIDEGAAAAADAVVVEIDPQRRKLDLASARARLAEAQASLIEQERETRRQESLFRRNVAAKAKLEQAETQLKLAGSRLQAAEAALGVAVRVLGDASVRAPFDGLVARRLVSEGEFVSPGTPLFELVSLDPLEVEFHLAEVDSSRVVVGQIIGVRVAPYPDEVFDAEVTMVSPTIDPRTRTLRVKGAVANLDGRLRPGLFARADLGIAVRSDVTMVPEESVLQRTDGSVVFRLTEGRRVERRVVELGVFHDGEVEIVRGLEAGDLVLTRGHADLIDGAVVQVRSMDGALAPGVAARRRDAQGAE